MKKEGSDVIINYIISNIYNTKEWYIYIIHSKKYTDWFVVKGREK